MRIDWNTARQNLKGASVPELQDLLGNVHDALVAEAKAGRDTTAIAAYHDAIVAERDSRPVPASLEQACGMSPTDIEAARIRAKTAWTCDELLNTSFPKPRWVVPDLLPVGLASLAGRPKLGKSWLALQLAVSVATGGRFLDVPVEQGPVIYLALEDAPRRLKGRLERLKAPVGAPIHFHTAWLPLNAEGAGLSDLQSEMNALQPRFVVIDTLTRACSGGIDWNDLGPVTGLLSELQHVAQLSDCCVLTIDHHKKPSGMSNNAVDDMLGSTAKAAVIDTVWGLYRDRDKRNGTLHVTGRDVDETQLAIEFDGLTCCWQPGTDGRNVAATEAEGEILRALTDLEGEADAHLIAGFLDKSRQGVAKVLQRMETQGKLCSRLKGGCRTYRVAPVAVV